MATDHEDTSAHKNGTLSKGDPEQEASRDAQVLVRGSRLAMRDLHHGRIG